MNSKVYHLYSTVYMQRVLVVIIKLGLKSNGVQVFGFKSKKGNAKSYILV